MQAQGLIQAGGAPPGETGFLFRTNGLKSLTRAYDEVLALPARNSGFVFSYNEEEPSCPNPLQMSDASSCRKILNDDQLWGSACVCVCVCVCVCLHSTFSLYLSTAANILIDTETEQDTPCALPSFCPWKTLAKEYVSSPSSSRAVDDTLSQLL